MTSVASNINRASLGFLFSLCPNELSDVQHDKCCEYRERERREYKVQSISSRKKVMYIKEISMIESYHV